MSAELFWTFGEERHLLLLLEFETQIIQCVAWSLTLRCPGYPASGIPLHYITLHYMHIHYTHPSFVPRQLNMQKVTNIHKTTHTVFIKGHIDTRKNIR